jgi:hypothetical protein
MTPYLTHLRHPGVVPLRHLGVVGLVCKILTNRDFLFGPSMIWAGHLEKGRARPQASRTARRSRAAMRSSQACVGEPRLWTRASNPPVVEKASRRGRRDSFLVSRPPTREPRAPCAARTALCGAAETGLEGMHACCPDALGIVHTRLFVVGL